MAGQVDHREHPAVLSWQRIRVKMNPMEPNDQGKIKACHDWLRQEQHRGEWSVGFWESYPFFMEYMIEDPDVAFGFKLRFG
ncbi:MAG: hypothetical protein EOO77_29330 [Oxalobacteraceae bacterium]|nr:MAG: hypothetical protein EOO77_29330 [Oxalobacteraceae bacterium]